MSNPFLGEIRIMGFGFPPKGWAFCNGQTLPINQNQALFALLGTTYGGNGVTTFLLPDVQSRVPVHFGAQYPLGAQDGVETVTMNASQMPAHTHSLNGAATPGAV